MQIFFFHHVATSFPLLATETAQQLKKTAGVPFHAKGRGLVKKIDTTSELEGHFKVLSLFTVKVLSSVKTNKKHHHYVNNLYQSKR